jgi:hypothetical protein
MDTHDSDATAALDAFAMSLIASCGQLSLILNHMHRHQEPDGAPPPVVLQQLLREVLEPLVSEHGLGDVATAVQMLDSATGMIGDELFLVDLSRFTE